jgi:hypothetical protein
MTVVDPTPTPDPTPDPTDPTYINKAIVSLAGWLAAVVVQWLASKHFNLGQEGVTLIAGAITTIGVWLVTNFRKILGPLSVRS